MATSNKDTFLAQVSPGASSFVQELKKFAAHADEIEYSLQIANRIMEIMDEQNISQKLLAEKMGVVLAGMLMLLS